LLILSLIPQSMWVNDIDELLKKYSVKEVMEVLDQIEAIGTRVKRLCAYSGEIREQKFKRTICLTTK
jgi:predicted HAD superfamily phosphohydrolase